MSTRRRAPDLWCSSCSSTGTVLCLCGGDGCHCGREEIPCPDCDGAPPAAYCEADDGIEVLETLVH